MAKKVVGVPLIPIIVIIVLLSGCKKFAKEGHCKEPGVVLTFDDDRADNWYENLATLDSLGIRATFYVCKYNRFTPEQKRKLAVIQSHGHEIAFHGTNHYNMEDYVYRQKHTIDELMRNEVENGLKLMNKDGFFPITFAYPYGAHNGVIDKTLMRYFKSVRALNGTNDFSKSIVPNEKNQLLYGLGIDKGSNRSDVDVMKVLESAKNNNACAILVSHDINTSIKLSTTIKRIREIAAYVKKNNLKYYTASEVSN